MTRCDGWITACTFGRTTAPENVSAGPEARASGAIQLILRGHENDLHTIIHMDDVSAPNQGRIDIRPGFDVSQVGMERHYAVVIDTADSTLGPHGSQHLYLDGYLVGSAALPAGVDGKLEDINNWLGRSLRRSPVFVGKYNEFRVYDRPLSAAEVLSSYLVGPDVKLDTPAPPSR